ncbi:Irregular chiasm C-roughest protein [Chionoecetes opilio]|uniref:Irregular chiasm C-roughest protein n=1 Tax=Chionoecetes opilio TaxID=41210 RepID=A0A8J4YA99_CHIOP|nr:Irregular chiasm C-roughest protein [Chionoecetes opilio]
MILSFQYRTITLAASDASTGDYSLRIQPVSLLDDGLFQCQVSASDGVPGIRSHAARLTVHVPPDPPVLTPAALNVTAGVPVILVCESSGGRPAPEIQWIDNSRRETIRTGSSVQTELLEDGKRVKVRSRLTFTPRRAHHNSSLTCLTSNQALNSPLTRWYHNSDILANETSRTLTLWRIGRSFHQDSVSCEVSNTVGAAKKTLSLQVRYGPAFRTLPRDVMAETGKKVTLRCDVASHPPPTIAWLRDASNQILGKGRDLVVRVRPKTAGLYVCVAHVQGFPDLRGTVRVLVKGPPTIVSAGEQEGRMGDTVSLECSTVSIPSPIRVTWTYKGREIDLTDPRYEVVVDRQEEGLRNVLVIHDADTHDFGAYNCSVVNEYGVARKQIRLNEENLPFTSLLPNRNTSYPIHLKDPPSIPSPIHRLRCKKEAKQTPLSCHALTSR